MSSKRPKPSRKLRIRAKAPTPAPVTRRRRRGPAGAAGGELDPKTKLSVSIAASDIAWVTERATERGIPVSVVFQEALELYRRDWKLEHLIKVTGGSDDITEADIEAVRDEWRAAGIKV